MPFVALVSLLLPGTGAARSIIAWTAPARCPDAASFQALVDAAVASEGGRSASLKVDGAMEAKAPGFVLHLVVTGPASTAERVLSDVDCRSLTAAGALIAGMLVDTLAAPPPPDPPVLKPDPIPPPIDEPPPKPPPLALPEPVHPMIETPRAPPDDPAWHLSAAFVALVDFGATPGVAPGGDVALRVSHRRWAFELHGLGTLSRSTAIPGAPGDFVAVRVAAIQPRGCWLAEDGASHVHVCAALEAGAIFGTGDLLAQATPGPVARPTVRAGVVLTSPALTQDRPVSFRLEADIGVALATPGFSVVPAGVVFRPDLQSARIAAGVAVAWP